MMAVVVVVVCGQRENGLALLVGQHVGRHGLVVRHPSDVVDEVGNVVRLRNHQHDVHLLFVCQQLQQFFQLVARLGIEPDEGVVHDKQPWGGEERLGELEFAQFAAREGDDVLVEQRLHVEQLVQVLLQLSALLAVRSCQQIGALQQFAHGGCLVVNVVLVPSQLQIVLAVHVRSVRVAEGDISYFVRGQLSAHLFYVLCLAARIESGYGCDVHRPGCRVFVFRCKVTNKQ